MLESFSSPALHVVSLATTEARGLRHSRIGTEHLLLGLLSDEDGGPAAQLRKVGASLAAARHKVMEVSTVGTGATTTEPLPFTARAQRALERAGRHSRQKREPEVAADSVLFGVLDVEGLACQVLRGLGVDVDSLHDGLVATSTETALAIVPEQPSVLEVGGPLCPWCRDALDDTLAEAVMSTNGDPGKAHVSVVYCSACGAALGVLRSPK
ncbi:MAG: Clp protease N-terminal domain-containing protein [Ilumatobacteraceae bacterium]